MNADLARALDQTRDFLTRYIVFANPEQADAAALWVGHTWTYDQFDTTPYLAVQSPEKRSGKSRLLECLRLVTRQAVPMAGASLAALFRIIDERHPTLLLDEADTIFNKRASDSTEDLRGLLNNGYRRGVPFFRVVGDGKKLHVESFDVFCPKAIASIQALPDTVQDRSVVIHLKRRARHERVERFRFRTGERESLPVREWWEATADQLVLPDTAEVPDQLDDRAADSWEPLLSLADAAGAEWPTRAHKAALLLSGVVEVEDEKIPILLLADIRAIFEEHAVERIATKVLMERLLSDDFEEHPWQEWHNGRGLKATGVGRLLAPFGIRAKQLWITGGNLRGYDLDQFTDAFDRYLPTSADTPSNRYTARTERESEHEPSGLAVQTPLAGWVGNGDEPAEPDPCEAHQCAHRYEADCTRRCETEEQLVEQVHWLRRNGWTSERGGAHVEQPAGDAA